MSAASDSESVSLEGGSAFPLPEAMMAFTFPVNRPMPP